MKNPIEEKICSIVEDVLDKEFLVEFGNDSSNDYEFVGTFRSSNIGEASLSMVGEDRVGNFDSYTVFIYSDDEGYVPHVHIILTNEIKVQKCKKTFDCCVKLETNEYFKRGCHQSTMTSRMCKDFNTFMHSLKKIRMEQCTFYEFAVDRWDDNSEHIRVLEQGACI